MSKYTQLILILVVIIFIVLSIDISMIAHSKKYNDNNSNTTSSEINETLENNIDDDNEELELVKYRSFNCTGEKKVFDNYTIDYFYYFIFKNNDLDSGYFNYIYTFNNLESYNAFKFSSSPNPIKEEFDIEKKTKTYTMGFYLPQEETGDNAIEKYIEQLGKNNYSCEENV